ncbi:hypothetical protein Cadr_000007276 [Camelus dromedarius]|uniref:Uncharacterized protein n=1 Tax=Camelus dromedarius TaxID=9838 RepID=A0A5N4E5I5_CAMDR|nr:hypothetical protein Cadr_000007276 [Camelus dromedarius]
MGLLNGFHQRSVIKLAALILPQREDKDEVFRMERTMIEIDVVKTLDVGEFSKRRKSQMDDQRKGQLLL